MTVSTPLLLETSIVSFRRPFVSKRAQTKFDEMFSVCFFSPYFRITKRTKPEEKTLRSVFFSSVNKTQYKILYDFFLFLQLFFTRYFTIQNVVKMHIEQTTEYVIKAVKIDISQPLPSRPLDVGKETHGLM